MEIGILFILVAMLIMAPVATVLSKTRIFQEIENKFFEDHNHYM